MRQGEEPQRKGRIYHIWSKAARAYGRLPMKNSSRPQFIIELNINLRMGGKLGSGQVKKSEAESSNIQTAMLRNVQCTKLILIINATISSPVSRGFSLGPFRFIDKIDHRWRRT